MYFDWVLKNQNLSNHNGQTSTWLKIAPDKIVLSIFYCSKIKYYVGLYGEMVGTVNTCLILEQLVNVHFTFRVEQDYGVTEPGGTGD